MPTQTELLAPVFALAGWTSLVLIWLAVARIRAGFAGKITPADFRFGDSPQVPAHVVQANRNYMNLLELPILFYVISTIMLLTGSATPLAVGLQWAYVVFRVVHSLIHLSYNNVLHRLAAFALSNFALVGLWLLIALRIWHPAA